jgi:hypothetical protein
LKLLFKFFIKKINNSYQHLSEFLLLTGLPILIFALLPPMNQNFTDLKNMASHLTMRRLWNLFLITGSYLVSKWTGKSRHMGLPVAVSIEPTTSCNLRCPECPSGLRSFTRPTGMLEPELFKKVIGELEKDLMYLIFYFQGEPYLNPCIPGSGQTCRFKKHLHGHVNQCTLFKR